MIEELPFLDARQPFFFFFLSFPPLSAYIDFPVKLSQVAENHMFASSISILEGEKFTALLEIENVGTKPVNYIKVEFEEKFPDGLSYEEDFYFSQNPLLICNEEKIKLPLMPFESIFVPIQIIGKYQR